MTTSIPAGTTAGLNLLDRLSTHIEFVDHVRHAGKGGNCRVILRNKGLKLRDFTLEAPPKAGMGGGVIVDNAFSRPRPLWRGQEAHLVYVAAAGTRVREVTVTWRMPWLRIPRKRTFALPSPRPE
ncbi:hypothetical protein [Streptomyces sp. NBC_01304]|uniref:hypothetical protein n=1 Tax=Streptomyces sp. NBC_01304 TaxID=2903818 RepID=UPI002E0E40ED|nr:hypothetical protein OG430_48470 [Streptomyces sp. NBC_01304]